MLRKTLSTLAVLASLSATSLAQQSQVTPTALQFDTLPVERVEAFGLGPIDQAAVDLQDEQREAQGLPPRYAISNAVNITPDTHGTVEVVDGDTLLWRLRIVAVDAASINLGFTEYQMPEGGQLMVYSPDGQRSYRPFTHLDNETHGELWTPPLPGDETVVEVTMPRKLFAALKLQLTHVGQGYRGFGGKPGQPPAESGACNVDVVCPQGDDWQNEIPCVAVISLGGGTFCTGFMVNNTSNDRTPYFMTAAHCGIGAGNAASLVTFWNYETSTCGGTPNGTLNQFNTGAVHRASYGPSDMTIVELDDDPNPAYGVTFCGWNRTGANESGAIAIHHPNTDEKRISFENQATSTTSYLGASVPGDGTHVRVLDWDVGTTEPGSSGSPLFNPAHQVIGQLHGGFAACGNDDPDWYGKVSVSWNGGGTNSTRLSTWLDPGNTGATSVDTLGTALSVTPSGIVLHEGPIGGPFTNSSVVYTLSNSTSDVINYDVSLANDIGVLINGGTSNVSGSLAANGGSTTVTVTLDSSVDTYGSGLYSETITFDDLTNAVTSTRQHDIEVGRIVAHSINMSSNPGWTMQGQWQYGQPTGGGGEHGLVDPTSGFTGPNVLGYNLNGDYPNNLPETHLTSTAFDCTGLTDVKVSFQRWLNVEQPLYDHAYFRVSNNGTTWTTIWENGSEITDSSWQHQEFDISAIADDESTVYLRWTQGTTDGSWLYSGWNIDDVEISGLQPSFYVNYGAGLAGSGGFTPNWVPSGDTSIGGSYSLALVDGLGGAPGQLYLGFTRASIPFKGGTFLIGPPLAGIPVVLTGAAGVPGAGGLVLAGSFTDPLLAGTTFQLQVLVADSGAIFGVAISDGLEVFIAL